MINRINFENFKCIKKLSCALGRLNIIVGPNACGKSSLLQGLDLLSYLVNDRSVDRIDSLFSGPRLLERIHTGNFSEPLRIECRNLDSSIDFGAAKGSNSFERESLNRNRDWQAGVIARSGGDGPDYPARLKLQVVAAPAETSIYYDLENLLLVRFDAYRISLPSYSDEEIPRVLHSGEGLASAVANLITSRNEQYEILLSRMAKIVPHLTRIRTERKKVDHRGSERIGDSLIFDFVNQTGVPAANVSEGTLFALGLLMIMHSQACPHVLLIDDIERGLHPLAQKQMVELLRQILDANPELQIIGTCHSPYFLDFLSFDEVKVMTLADDGYSIVGTLKDHPKFEKWKEELAPGEMWSLFGEKWLAGDGRANA